ncbi:MAG: ATP-dependent DNA helicase RecG [Verrucomicrobia bacterium]|nr:MAG: ATP-dependent DNA helicase RecG [Verrucomicrobiota bacterium]
MHWDTPLKELPWVGPQRSRQLTRFGLETLGDLVSHFPKRWENRSRFDRFPQEESDLPVCVCGLVQTAAVQRRGRTRNFEIRLVEEQSHALAGQITVRWYNLFWIEKVVAAGVRLVVYGKPKRRGRQLVFEQPEFEVLEEDAQNSLHLQRIVPIHRATEGLSTRMLRWLIWEALQHLDAASLPALIPASLDATPRLEALRQIHFPDSFESLSLARKHLVLTEFFGMQLCIAQRRAQQQAEPGLCHAGPTDLLKRLHSSLPFPLTNAQLRSIAEIQTDMASARPMNRLLHGDVGAGKTLVALSAMLLAVEAGFQAALMAPTQILAEQHYLQFQRLCTPLGIRVGLRTGTRREESGPLPLFDHDRWQQAVASGSSDKPAVPPQEQPDILVGTHALLHHPELFTRLGLAVIDEQHKFGVLQRASLRAQGRCPDMLVMTATPIPRTLTMSLYGDLDVSILDELPKGRGKIVTGVRAAAKIPEAAKFIRSHLEAGRQAYIVYPLIDASEKTEAKAAAAEFEKWQTLLEPLPCALLHGRIPPEEKDAIMEKFRSGETKALIATTVIEVGIDVPNANMMLIENSERFGLAQLHQLRGRVGRGAHKSYCILLTDAADPESLKKLEVLERTTNGFDIAEADWELRGPGDLLGTAQSGLPPLRIGNLTKDSALMLQARGAAFVVIERDPLLQEPAHLTYRSLLAQAPKADLSQVS